MPHHYPKSTVQADYFCRKCGKNTPHYVYDGRLGRCMNDHAVVMAPPACRQDDKLVAQMPMFADYTIFDVEPESAKSLSDGEIWGEKL